MAWDFPQHVDQAPVWAILETRRRGVLKKYKTPTYGVSTKKN